MPENTALLLERDGRSLTVSEVEQGEPAWKRVAPGKLRLEDYPDDD